MSKQNTAVSKIINELKSLGIYTQTLQTICEQSKELEKQQHEKTWFDSTMQFANESEMINKKYFDDYYTETFNQ